MAFCSECGTDIGSSKFCSECGFKVENTSNKISDSKKETNQSKPAQEFYDSRNIDRYLEHLRKLAENKKSVIIEEDLVVYEKTLRSIPEEDFKRFYVPSFVKLKSVKDINKYLGVDVDFTSTQIGRAYKSGKAPEAYTRSFKSEKETSKNAGKNAWEKLSKTKKIVILVVVLALLGGILGGGGPSKCECLKALTYKDTKGISASCVRKYYDAAFDYVEVKYPNDRFQNQEAVLQSYFYDKCNQ